MPSALTYPGVYIEEVPSNVRTIIGASTSIAAFVGRTQRGPVNLPVVINSFADFERQFGGLWLKSPLSFAVRDFYLNGGGQAVIVRLFSPSFADETAREEAYDAATDEAQTAAEAVADAANNAVAGAANAGDVANAAQAAVAAASAPGPAAASAAEAVSAAVA
ncbi:phage tail sheath family protein, partial [Sphingomonas parva]